MGSWLAFVTIITIARALHRGFNWAMASRVSSGLALGVIEAVNATLPRMVDQLEDISPFQRIAARQHTYRHFQLGNLIPLPDRLKARKGCGMVACRRGSVRTLSHTLVLPDREVRPLIEVQLGCRSHTAPIRSSQPGSRNDIGHNHSLSAVLRV
jgi:hypothetical protein